MKSINIKVWPEICGYFPLLFVVPKISGKGNPLYLDFKNTKDISSSGLNCFLFKLIKEINEGVSVNYWFTHDDIISDGFKRILKLNFFSVLDKYLEGRNDLWGGAYLKRKQEAVVTFDDMGLEVKSFPIYMVDFERYDCRRDALIDVREWLRLIFADYLDDYCFSFTQFQVIINEIVKNTADHTCANAFIGIDVVRSAITQCLDITFSVGDLGEGINNNVRMGLHGKDLSRYRNWDITQTYKAALSDGYTTKNGSKLNKGLGMSLIMQSAKNMRMSLSVFDAKSRGLLDKIESITHREIRKNFYNIDRYVGFAYYGQFKVYKK